jgi:dolichol-phosphate mannosyltransferase
VGRRFNPVIAHHPYFFVNVSRSLMVSVFYPMSKDFVLISVVVPVLNEEKNVPDLIREIADAAAFAPITEMIFVDDGSTDGTLSVLKSLKSQYPMLRVLRHHERARQSAAMWTGVQAARHNIVITMDGDGQNNPADIPNLYAAYQKIRACEQLKDFDAKTL